MSSKHYADTYPQEMLSIAKRDYDAANRLNNDTTYPKLIEAICYHSQQAIEKSIKSILAYHDIKFRKTHDIDLLLTLCKDFLPSDFAGLDKEKADRVTSYASDSRYPESPADLDENDLKFALNTAKKAIAEAEQLISPEASKKPTLDELLKSAQAKAQAHNEKSQLSQKSQDPTR